MSVALLFTDGHEVPARRCHRAQRGLIDLGCVRASHRRKVLAALVLLVVVVVVIVLICRRLFFRLDGGQIGADSDVDVTVSQGPVVELQFSFFLGLGRRCGGRAGLSFHLFFRLGRRFGFRLCGRLAFRLGRHLRSFCLSWRSRFGWCGRAQTRVVLVIDAHVARVAPDEVGVVVIAVALPIVTIALPLVAVALPFVAVALPIVALPTALSR